MAYNVDNLHKADGPAGESGACRTSAHDAQVGVGASKESAADHHAAAQP